MNFKNINTCVHAILYSGLLNTCIWHYKNIATSLFSTKDVSNAYLRNFYVSSLWEGVPSCLNAKWSNLTAGSLVFLGTATYTS
jgi:hypothetical protein